MYKWGILSKGILQLDLFHQGAKYRFMCIDYIHCLDWSVRVVGEIPPTVHVCINPSQGRIQRGLCREGTN